MRRSVDEGFVEAEDEGLLFEFGEGIFLEAALDVGGVRAQRRQRLVPEPLYHRRDAVRVRALAVPEAFFDERLKVPRQRVLPRNILVLIGREVGLDSLDATELGSEGLVLMQGELALPADEVVLNNGLARVVLVLKDSAELLLLFLCQSRVVLDFGIDEVGELQRLSLEYP